MEFLHSLVFTLMHLNPATLGQFVDQYQTHLYVIFFAIVFCETGLVVTPFLPGDSLLFTIGAVAGSSSTINLVSLGVLLCLAANCGDMVNYLLGYGLGPKVFSQESSRLLNKKHLAEAQGFYEKYGGKTIILARFVPIIRTFAPFVAGIGRMNPLRFGAFSVFGGALWVTVCLTAGYTLAKNPFMNKHFQLVILAIIAVSLLPALIHVVKARSAAGKS